MAIHRYQIPVFYQDTDAGGVVYHANYLTYGERARSQMLKDVGLSNSVLWKERGLAFMVKDAHIDYLKPAVLDDELTVETQICEFGRASFTAHHAIKRGAETAVSLKATLVCVTLNPLKPAKIPDDLKTLLEKYKKETP